MVVNTLEATMLGTSKNPNTTFQIGCRGAFIDMSQMHHLAYDLTDGKRPSKKQEAMSWTCY